MSFAFPAGEHQGVNRLTKAGFRVERPDDVLGAKHLDVAQPVPDVVRFVEDVGVLRPTGPIGQVRPGVTDQEEGSPRGERSASARDHLGHLAGGKLQIGKEDEVNVRGLGFERDDVGAPPFDGDAG